MAQQKTQNGKPPTESENYTQIYQNYKNINKIIDDLDVKVDQVIEQHEAQFLIAYRNHIKKIKYELRQLKENADQQEKKLSDNDRMFYLQKQITIFRQEALKLYDKLEERSQQTQIYKARVKDLEKNTVVEQVQLKELIKNTKILQAKLHLSQSKVAELQQFIKSKEKTISELSLKHSKGNTQSQTKNISNYIQSNKLRTVSNSKPLQFKISKKKSFKSQDNELKDWFIQCIRTIKRDVAFRKNSGSQFDLGTIGSIEEFKMVDKLRLLQKFMENQKLLTWMYQKIFPSRLNEIREYLSQKSITHVEKSQQTHQQQELVQGFYDQIFEKDKERLRAEIILPKMASSKAKTSQIRNKVSVRHGKLNISAV